MHCLTHFPSNSMSQNALGRLSSEATARPLGSAGPSPFKRDAWPPGSPDAEKPAHKADIKKSTRHKDSRRAKRSSALHPYLVKRCLQPYCSRTMSHGARLLQSMCSAHGFDTAPTFIRSEWRSRICGSDGMQRNSAWSRGRVDVESFSRSWTRMRCFGVYVSDPWTNTPWRGPKWKISTLFF